MAAPYIVTSPRDRQRRTEIVEKNRRLPSCTPHPILPVHDEADPNIPDWGPQVPEWLYERERVEICMGKLTSQVECSDQPCHQHHFLVTRGKMVLLFQSTPPSMLNPRPLAMPADRHRHTLYIIQPTRSMAGLIRQGFRRNSRRVLM